MRLLRRRNFDILVGFALFGAVYILPQYLGQVQRYNAEQIGNVLAWTGLPQLMLIPIVPMLMRRYDVRIIAALGIAIFAASCFMNITLSLGNAGDQFWLPNIVRANGQALVITPVSAITTVGIEPSEAGSASGLSNMLRNLGGAVGTAILSTVLTKREQFHSNIIGQAVTLSRDEVRERINGLTSYFMAMVYLTLRQPSIRRSSPSAPSSGASADHGLQRRLRRDGRVARHSGGRSALRTEAIGEGSGIAH